MVIQFEGDGCLHAAIEKYKKADEHRDSYGRVITKLIQDRENALDTIRRARTNRTLCPFLGAGVSLSAGLPGWGKLVAELADHAIWLDLKDRGSDDILSTSSFLTATLPVLARLVKQVLPEELFLSTLHSFLYRGVQDPVSSSLIETVCRLIADGDPVPVPRLITYNYDDLVERELSRRGCTNISITDESELNTASGIQVCHVHGLLPRKDYQSASLAKIVLSEEEYNRLISTNDNWVNRIQEEALRRCCCLFIGTSLQDPNLRRLLDRTRCHAQANRYVIFTPKDVFRADLPTHSEWEGTPNDQRLDRIRNVYLPAYRQSLISRATESLGVTCIWLDSHDDIPRFLDQIMAPTSQTPKPAEEESKVK